MRWVDFTASVQFECEGRRKGPNYAQGERYHFEDAIADRWLRRGVAKTVDGPVAKVRAKEETPPSTPKPDTVPLPISPEAKPVERPKPR